jgi:catechol 2,3-dioxygenase-like lactoylglutathione lyase family enzyme
VVRKRKGVQLSDAQWMVVGGAVIIAIFLAAMAFGRGEVDLLLVALLVLVLAAVGVILVDYFKTDQPLPGTGTVLWVSTVPRRSGIVGACEMQLNVLLEGERTPRSVLLHDHNTPLLKWPRRGMVLPLEAPPRRPDKAKIFWDQVAPGSGGGSAPRPPAPPTDEPPGPPDVHTPPVFTSFRSDAGAPTEDQIHYEETGREATDDFRDFPPAPGEAADPEPVPPTPAGSPWQSPPGARAAATTQATRTAEPTKGGAPAPNPYDMPTSAWTAAAAGGAGTNGTARPAAASSAATAGGASPAEPTTNGTTTTGTTTTGTAASGAAASPWMDAPARPTRDAAASADLDDKETTADDLPPVSDAFADDGAAAAGEASLWGPPAADEALPRFTDDAMPRFVDDPWAPPPQPRAAGRDRPAPDAFDSYADEATRLVGDGEPLPRRVPPQRGEANFPPDEVIVGEVLGQRAAVGQTVHGVGTKLYVADIDRARHFYRDIMGFTEVAAAGERAEFRFPGGRLLLRRVHDNPVPARNLRRLLLDVTDIAAVYHDLEREGAACRSRPHRTGGEGRSEMWVATLEDPDGNIIELNEPIAFGTRR